MINLDVLAGKMIFDGKKVSPDPRKGILRLLIDAGPGDQVKVQWLDRSEDPPKVELELAAPVTVELVPSVKTGKVLVLKQESGEKHFVWIQQQASGTAAGDAAGLASGSIDNVDSLINQIQMFAQMRSGQAAAEMYSQIFGGEEEPEVVPEDQMVVDLGHHAHEGIDDGDDEGDDDEAEFEALMEQLISGQGDQLSGDQMAQILIMNPEIQQSLIAQFVLMASNFMAIQGAPVQGQQDQVHQVQVQVRDILQTEKAIESLKTEQEKLLALCPEGETDISQVIRSPQFGEALRLLTEGIYSDQISILFASLGLDIGQLSPHQDPLEALCKALENKFRSPL